MKTNPAPFSPMPHSLPCQVNNSWPIIFQTEQSWNSSSLPFEAHLPVDLESDGGSWKGTTRHLSQSQLAIELQGYPPLRPGQALQIQLGSYLNIAGMVKHTQEIQLRSHASLPGLHCTIQLEALDDLKYHYLRTAFTTPSRHQRPTGIHIRTISFKTNDGLRVIHSGKSQPSFLTITPSTSGNTPPPLPVTSTSIEIRNRQGQRIAAYLDSPASLATNSPLVVMAPGYGETKREYITLAYYLAANGCRVLRYDHTNHVGDSDGEHLDVTLSSMKDDMDDVITYTETTWPNSPTTLLASSLAGRVALKTVSHYHRLKALILLVSIVDVQHSLAAVHQEDLFAAYLQGHHPPLANVLGLNVRDQFLADALAAEYASLESTCRDAERIQTPVVFFTAEHDAWVQLETVQKIAATLPPHLVTGFAIPAALHRLQENPRNARMVYRQVVASCRHLTGLLPNGEPVAEPTRKEIGMQNRLEREAAQTQGKASAPLGNAFWTDYLANFHSIGMCPDYLKLLDHVFRVLGPIEPGTKILDAGCGNGQVGMFFMLAHLSQARQTATPTSAPIQYTGIDFVPQALRQAQANLAHSLAELQKQAAPHQDTAHPMSISLAQMDLNQTLPFQDNQFSRIVCNLVIGYLNHPTFTLNELYRVLAPGGRLVITNLKPEGDFSGIYRNIVEHPGAQDVRREAKELLNNYGKIKLAEKDGQFQFYDKRQWREAVHAIGCHDCQIYPTFANQAFLIFLEKPRSLSMTPLSSGTMTAPEAFPPGTEKPLGVAA